MFTFSPETLLLTLCMCFPLVYAVLHTRSRTNMHTLTDIHLFKDIGFKEVFRIFSYVRILSIVHFIHLHTATKGDLSGIDRVCTFNLYIDTSVLVLCGPCTCECVCAIHYNAMHPSSCVH